MQADERKEIETNSLAKWTQETWEKLQKKSLYTYVFIIGIVVLAILAWNWYLGSQGVKDANAWIALEELNSKENIKSFIEKHRGEMVGNIAKLQLARIELSRDGLLKLGTREAEQQKNALTSIAEARKIYLEVAPLFKDSPSFQIEAWQGAASAEESLIGAKLEGNAEVTGDITKAIEYYEKAVALLGETEEGKKLKEYVKSLQDNKDQVVKNYRELYQTLTPITPIIDPLKKEEPKKDETKKDEGKQEGSKKEDVKKEEPKKEEPKKDIPKNPEVKKDETKKDEPNKDTSSKTPEKK
jgi:hypothetical protein